MAVCTPLLFAERVSIVLHHPPISPPFWCGDLLVVWGLGRVGQLIPRWFDTPDLTTVFGDCAIAGEFATGCDVVDRHFEPFRLVLKLGKRVIRVEVLCSKMLGTLPYRTKK